MCVHVKRIRLIANRKGKRIINRGNKRNTDADLGFRNFTFEGHQMQPDGVHGAIMQM